MIDQDQIEKLLVEWETARENGAPITVEELCSDCPEYIVQIRPQVLALEQMYNHLFPETFVNENTIGGTPGDSLINPPGYELQAKVGSGGMGIVYKARQVALDRSVAIKLIRDSRFASPKQISRFQMEAAALADINHPNIVDVYDVGTFENRPFLVFEYVNGGNLAEWLQNHRASTRETVQFVQKLGKAVQAAHDRGIIHRDLKPGNVLLHVDNQSESNRTLSELIPKITDFGIAKRMDGERELTLSGEIIGSLDYMAPEQAMGNLFQIGRATDVYSLGVILYEMLTGVRPLEAHSQAEKLTAIQNVEVLEPSRYRPEISKDLDTICLRCLQKSPADRYSSARELADDLNRYLSGEPILARSIGPVEKLVRWCRRNPAIASLTLLLITFVTIGMGGITWSWREAVLAKAQSEVDLARARAAVDEYLFAISEETLLNEPGMQSLREDLLRSAATYYQEMISDHDEESDLNQDLALAHSRLGRVELMIGTSSEARKQLETAKQIVDKLKTKDDRLNRLLAAIEHDLGILEYRQGNYHQALEFFDSSIRCHDIMSDRNQDEENDRLALVNSLRIRGIVSLNIGGFDDSRADLERAVEIGNRSLDTANQPDKFGSLLAEVFDSLALVEKQTGDLGNAIVHFDQAKSLLQQLVDKNPGIQKYQQSLNRVLNNLGNAFYSNGQFEKADQSMRVALELAEDLVQQSPDVISYRITLADNLNNLGNLQRAQNRLSDALDSFRRSQSQRLDVLSRDAMLVEVRNDLTNSLNNLGTIHADLGEYRTAIAYFRDSISHSNQISEVAPGLMENEVRRVTTAKNLAQDLQHIGDLTSAMATIEVGIAQGEKNLSRFQTNMSTIVSLASAYRVRGNLLQKSGRLPQAISSYQQSQQLWMKVAKETRELASNRSRMSGLQFDLGECYRLLGDSEKAMSSLRLSDETLAALLNEFPENHKFQRQHSIALSRLASLYLAQQKYDEAEERYRSAVDLSESLASSIPENQSYQSLDSFNQLGLANCLQLSNKVQQAREICEQVLKRLDSLQIDSTENPEWLKIRNLANMYLGDALVRERKTKLALEHQQRAMQGWLELIQLSPGLIDHEVGLGVAVGNLGANLRKSLDMKSAMEVYTTGIETIENSLKNNPGHRQLTIIGVNLRWGRARVYNTLAEFESAANDWERAIELSPQRQHRLFRMERAWSLNRAGQPNLAIEESERMLSAEPDNPEVLFAAARHHGQALNALMKQDDVTDQQQDKIIQRCYQLIERAQQAGYFDKPASVQTLKRLTDFRVLRKDDRFDAFYDKLTN